MKLATPVFVRCLMKPSAVFCTLLLLCASELAVAQHINGLGSYFAMGREQYIAKLSLAAPSSESHQILQRDAAATMELRVASKRISQRRFNAMWIEAITVNSESSLVQQHMKELLSFNQMFKGSLYQGDQLIFDYKPQTGMTVLLNDVALGEIHSGSFFRILLASWIGPVPVSSSFREQMLSPHAQDDTLLQRFAALAPQPTRSAEITGWLQSSTAPTAGQNTVAEIKTPQQRRKAQIPAAPKPKPKPKPKITDSATTTQITKTATAATPVQQSQKVIPAKPAVEPEEEPFALTEETLEAQQKYYARVSSEVIKFKALPRQAFQRRLEGDVRIRVTLNRDGTIQLLELEQPSRHKLLNQQALDAASEAAPFPPVPQEVSGKLFAFSVPMNYRLPY